MFNPSQDDVRRFFCGVQAKAQAQAPMDALETLAGQWLAEHPEYEADLADAEAAVAQVYDGQDGRTNPFLHLSMHLSISEQCSIDQPQGIRQAVELLTARRDSLHEAHHQAMECLGQMLWESQRAGRPPDGQAYIDCVQRRATR
jgi:spermidine/putrescine-binding protein